MVTSMTPLQTLLDIKVGGLDEYVDTRRTEGKSWRVISNDLRDDTGIDITYETLRGWFIDEKAAS